jgi:hypothetical protein
MKQWQREEDQARFGSPVASTLPPGAWPGRDQQDARDQVRNAKPHGAMMVSVNVDKPASTDPGKAPATILVVDDSRTNLMRVAGILKNHYQVLTADSGKRALELATRQPYPIAYGIIAKHQGKIEVESVVGSGTTFTLTLPIEPAGPQDAAAAEG